MSTQDRIKELQQQIEEEKRLEREQAHDEAKKIGVRYDYTVTWLNNHVFRGERILCPEIREARKAWREKYPHVGSPWFNDDNQVQSMNYILVQNVFMSVSGGYCILKSSRKEERFGRDYEPLILTLDEVRDLRKGVVPDSLKAE